MPKLAESRFTFHVSRLAPITFLVLLVAAFFWEAALLQRTFFQLDLAIQNYPFRHFFAEQWKQGRYPLWCPQILGGYPLFAEGQSGAAYPLNLLLYPFLKTWVAMNLSVVLHYALAAVGMYLLLRLWAGRWGAVLGAVCYALNGWMVGHLIHLNAVSAAAWIPLAFYFVERAFREGERGNVLLAALALAMPWLAGHAQVALYAWVAVALFLGFRGALEWRKSRQSPMGPMGLMGPIGSVGVIGLILFLIAFGIAAIQILPTRELLQHSDRGGTQSYEFLTHGSVPPPLLALLVMPRLFGSLYAETAWFSRPDVVFHEMNFYLGLLPLLLAVFALARRRDLPTLFFAVLLALSGLFMLGKYSPFYRLHELIPVFNRLRMPGRYAYLVVFSLSALAGLGADQFLRLQRTEDDRQRRTEWKLLLGGATAILLLPLLVGLWGYQSFDASPELTVQLHEELFVDGVRTACFLILSVGLLVAFLTRTRVPEQKWLFAATIIVVVLDLWSANRVLNPMIGPSYYEGAPDVVRWLKDQRTEDRSQRSEVRLRNPASNIQHPGSSIQYPDERSSSKPDLVRPASSLRRFRIYDFDRRKHPSEVRGWIPRKPPHSQEWTADVYARREWLNGSTPMSYGIASLDGHVGIYPDRWWALDANITPNRLGLMAVRYAVGDPPRGHEWFRKVRADTPEPIYENLKAAPRAFIARRALRFPGLSQALIQALESPDFDPKTTVLLEDPQAPEMPQPPKGHSVQFQVEEPDRIVLDVESDAPAYLVLADSWSPGWEAAINDQPAPIYRANFYARAVFVPAGRHLVRFEYRPASFRTGAWVTLAAALLGLFGGVLTRKRRFLQLTDPEELLSPPEARQALVYVGIAALFVLALSLVMELGLWVGVFS